MSMQWIVSIHNVGLNIASLGQLLDNINNTLLFYNN